MRAQGIPPDTISYNSLICCYEKVNMPEKALQLFERMAVRVGGPLPVGGRVSV